MQYLINPIVLLITIMLFGFIIKNNFNFLFNNKVYIGNTYYYFINTNVKEYIKHIDYYKPQNTDKIVVDKMGHISFDMYSNNRYRSQVIYLANDLIPLDKILAGTKIWFYNTKYVGWSDEWINEINYWIGKNCKIIIRKKDKMGELLYVDKIK
ncbi:MAG: hypothetical protein ACI37R_00735 [Candidatus Avigastranaerophilus sp.]